MENSVKCTTDGRQRINGDENKAQQKKVNYEGHAKWTVEHSNTNNIRNKTERITQYLNLQMTARNTGSRAYTR